MPTATHSKSITFPAESALEADRKAVALEALAANLTVDNLALIAKASKKPGANQKIKQYSAFL